MIEVHINVNITMSHGNDYWNQQELGCAEGRMSPRIYRERVGISTRATNSSSGCIAGCGTAKHRLLAIYMKFKC